MRPIPVILDQHAEDAALLWLRRHEAVDAPHYDRTHLARLDEQLEAHVDGLRIAGPHGWDHAVEAWESVGEAGELFTLAFLAFDLDDDTRIAEVLGHLGANRAELLAPVISALGWLDLARVRDRIEAMLADPDPIARLVALGGASVHRHDPDRAFVPLLDDSEPFVRARAARLAGELGRADLRAAVMAEHADDTDESRFWTRWAATMLGEREAGPAFLLDCARDPEAAEWDLAFRTGLLALGADAGWQWLDGLPHDAHGIALRITGFGLLGETQAVDWLITQMENPETGFLAGEAYSMITGVDLAYDDLDTDPPPDWEPGPNDDPDDDDVTMDPNEDLPLPHPALVARHWAALQPDLPRGRLFLGRERTPVAFEHGFAIGYQRQRRLAAFALALRQEGAPLPNWRAPVRGISLF